MPLPASVRAVALFRCVLLALATCLAGAALAQPGDAPTLTLEGRIGAPGSGPLQLSLQDLQKLPQHSFETNTPWSRTPRTFSGPLLRDVLALAQARGTSIRARALNEYQVVIPVEDARRFEVIVAHHIDGKPIPVRDKGPFFVIYPFDRASELRTAVYYGRSIWQLKSMTID